MLNSVSEGSSGPICTSTSDHPWIDNDENIFPLSPGRLGSLRSTTLSARNLSSAFPGHLGYLLNLRAIEQGLENLSQVPRRQIVPGREAGQSDLHVHASPYAPWQWLLGLEYAQGASLGRFSGQLSSPLGISFGLMSAVSSLSNRASPATGQPRSRQTPSSNRSMANAACPSGILPSLIPSYATKDAR